MCVRSSEPSPIWIEGWRAPGPAPVAGARRRRPPRSTDAAVAARRPRRCRLAARSPRRRSRRRPVTLPTIATAKTGFDWEHLIAGQWLNRVGLGRGGGRRRLLPEVRDRQRLDWPAAGRWRWASCFGAGLLASAPWLLKRRLVYFADGVTGLGAAVLYLSLWAAGSYYQLLPPAATFIAMAVVTAAMVAIAVGRRSLSVAVMAMIGGFVAPVLVSTGRDAQVELFTYLALHNAALLVLAWRREWRVLELPAFRAHPGVSSGLVRPLLHERTDRQHVGVRPAVLRTVLCHSGASQPPRRRRPSRAGRGRLAGRVRAVLLVLREHALARSPMGALRGRRSPSPPCISSSRARGGRVSAWPDELAAPKPVAGAGNCCLPAWR